MKNMNFLLITFKTTKLPWRGQLVYLVIILLIITRGDENVETLGLTE